MVNYSTSINKTNNHLSPKESLNSDGQLFYQYQQNKQSPLTYRKYKQWLSTILPVSTKQTITSHLKKVYNSDGQLFYQYQQNKQSPLT